MIIVSSFRLVGFKILMRFEHFEICWSRFYVDNLILFQSEKYVNLVKFDKKS